jgi:hypothetical protein
VSLPTFTRAAHDLALGALIGGNLFGRLAMSPALEEVSDKSERGKVLNRAWRRYGTINSAALAVLVAGRLADRQSERRLTTSKDVAVGGVAITGLASAASGVGFAQQAPGGAVPMQSGLDVAPETPQRAARIKRVVNALGALNLASEVALAVLSAYA